MTSEVVTDPSSQSAPQPAEDAEQPEHPTAAVLQKLLLTTDGMEEFLQQVVDVAVRTVGGHISAGITVVRDGHPATVASSNADASRFEEIQYGQDEGPCLAAIDTGEAIVVDDLVTEERFLGWRADCLAFGLRSALAVPMDGGTDAVGALNFYSHEPHTFGTDLQAQGQRFADEASRALALAARLAQHATLNEQLQTALTSRTIIDQAMGIIMGQNRCNTDEAFGILRSASQHRNAKLRTIAQEIVDAIGRNRREQEH